MSKKQKFDLAFELAKKRYSSNFPTHHPLGYEDGVERADVSFKKISSALTRRKIAKMLASE